jgi:hypothetical protein
MPRGSPGWTLVVVAGLPFISFHVEEFDYRVCFDFYASANLYYN